MFDTAESAAIMSKAIGKPVPRDLDAGSAEEDSAQFEESEVAEVEGEED